MSVSVQDFREAFPAFGDAADARVGFWLKLASKQLNAARWGDLLPEGTCLFVAHNLELEREAAKVGASAAAAGPVVSESQAVGGVSLSESRAGTAATGNLGAGHYNLTIYGQQYWQLAQIVGMGGSQL